MSSENPSGADNQQETAGSKLELEPQWVVGFVDGEGCFSVSIHRNSNACTTGGWQLHPVFHVYQHLRYRAVLEELVSFFGCGRIRAKGPTSSVLTFAVDGLRDLERCVLPFFERHPLVVKANDFRNFALIVRSMRSKDHLTERGFEHAVRLAYAMNAEGKQRSRRIDEILVGSSETARWAPLERKLEW
jgi:LAGLIDADG endonuclease